MKVASGRRTMLIDAESDFAFGDDHLRAKRGVVVHVVDVVGEGRVGVVDDGDSDYRAVMALDTEPSRARTVFESSAPRSNRRSF